MRYLITGGSGYIGTRLIETLSGREQTERIVSVDVRPPAHGSPAEHVRGDVRDRPAIRALLERERPDALIHLAFIFNPIRDEALMYDVDVNGTAAALIAASETGVEQVLVISSASAYGAFPDNPVPIAEDWPVRGQPDFSYARDKADADRVCQLWAADHPDRTMTILRPCAVFGPSVDNYLLRVWSLPLSPVPDGVDQEFQLVHEDDLVSALIGLLDARAAGAFNVAADGTMMGSEASELVGQRTRDMSLRAAKRLFGAMWRLHVPKVEVPRGALDFVRYPWLVSNEKLKTAIGWQPEYTTRETFEITMRAKGRLRAEAPPAPVTTRA
jgi:UDP-glucose 4-epimerase